MLGLVSGDRGLESHAAADKNPPLTKPPKTATRQKSGRKMREQIEQSMEAAMLEVNHD
jgi:hypothetical protein